MKATVKEYVLRIDKAYREARQQYSELWEQHDKINEQLKELSNQRGDYTYDGLMKRQTELEKKRSETLDKLRNVVDEFNQNAAAIRAKCADDFSSRYGIDPAKIDSNAMMLVNSGTLSPAELYGLAQRYADNSTMQRLIGGVMSKSDDAETAAYGAVIVDRSRQQPHMDLLNSYMTVASAGLRLSEGKATPEECRSMSDGVNEQLYEGAFSEACTKGDSIEN